MTLAITASSRRHAVVIGGSMSGLLAARVLADLFERVTIVERDHYPADPVPRKGVPQAHHVHVLLRRGMLILEQLFPTIAAELAAAGAVQVDWFNDLSWVSPAGRGKRFPSAFVTQTASRALLEHLVWQHIMANPKIAIKQDHDVVGLLASEDKTRVVGVQCQPRGQASVAATVERLEADLVIDASGRSTHTPDWLQVAGYARPLETVINSFFGYAARFYRRPVYKPGDWKVLMVRDWPPGGTRNGTIFPIENERWIVNLGGACKDYPPTDEAGYLEFAHSLIDPAVYDAIKDAEPVSSINGYRRTENHWLHYEKLPRWPEGLVVVGDAACAFNPVYGQGMSVAGMDALALGECLRRSDWSARGFQRTLAQVVRIPWLLATGEDARVVGVEGAQRRLTDAFAHRYINEVQWLAASSRPIYVTFTKVLHLVEPPTSLLRPSIAAKVLLRMLRR